MLVVVLGLYMSRDIPRCELCVSLHKKREQ